MTDNRKPIFDSLVSRHLDSNCEVRKECVGAINAQEADVSDRLEEGWADPSFIEELADALYASHPAWQPPEKASHKAIQRSICRIETETTAGTGFFTSIDGESVVLTCAHVVASSEELELHRPLEYFIRESFSAEIHYLDLANDLAVLRYDESDLSDAYPVEELELGHQAPVGSKVVAGGFPARSEMPQYAQGTIARHHDKSPLAGRGIAPGPILDMSVNPGNSGGPVCTPDGRLVGIISAMPLPLSIATVPADEDAEQPVIGKVHNANNGIGHAIDPKRAQVICQKGLSALESIWREFNKYSPDLVDVEASRFKALQAEADQYVDESSDWSTAGPFSFDSNGRIWLGWSSDSDRKPLDVDGLEDILRKISGWGGSFFLRGREAVLYRQKYKGYITPVRFSMG